MSHEVETMAWANQVPWHGLGVEVTENLTAYQMLEAASLDWEVSVKPAYCRVGNKMVHTGKGGLIRHRKIDGEDVEDCLDVVGMEWKPVQNHTAMEFFTEFLSAGNMKMHTAGSLHGGRMIWGLAKTSEDFVLQNGDKVESYLLFSNPHQYGKCVDIRFTPIRVVCNNTLTFALNSQASNFVKFNHSRTFNQDEAKKVLGLAEKKMSAYKVSAETLVSKTYTKEKLVEYFGEIFGESTKDSKKLSRTGEQAINWVEKQPGAEYNPKSWWNAFNTVTFMTDHVLGNSADTRMNSAWFGVNQKRKQVAMQKALDYASVA